MRRLAKSGIEKEKASERVWVALQRAVMKHNVERACYDYKAHLIDASNNDNWRSDVVDSWLYLKASPLCKEAIVDLGHRVEVCSLDPTTKYHEC